jgi:hypothetical protein
MLGVPLIDLASFTPLDEQIICSNGPLVANVLMNLVLPVPERPYTQSLIPVSGRSANGIGFLLEVVVLFAALGDCFVIVGIL